MSKFISQKVNNWLKTAQTGLYPLSCFICQQAGQHGLDLCPACRRELSPIELGCSICGIELSTANAVCGRCLKSPPAFNRVEAPYRYQGSARFLIQQLKFQSKYCCARIIGSLMASHLKPLNKTPDALMAVPLHIKRLSERGFNQSELIAQHLQQQLKVPLRNQPLTRLRNTAKQSSLHADDRRNNIHQAFSYQASDKINSIAIIDDVVTTGATADELAKTLKQAGVEKVEIWAFARA
ncbi:phosphoribosyltransferase [Cycloclasticus sp. 46_120_T64]|nr:phosphoribosyltransferase [Cycloclasticus sp. 46_120_T64]